MLTPELILRSLHDWCVLGQQHVAEAAHSSAISQFSQDVDPHPQILHERGPDNVPNAS